MAHRGQSLLVCPECARKGVSLRLNQEDWFTCRYCQWTVSSAWTDPIDLVGRQALRDANPGHRDAPMPEETYD